MTWQKSLTVMTDQALTITWQWSPTMHWLAITWQWSLTMHWLAITWQWSLTRLWPSLTVIIDQTLTITWQWFLIRLWPSPDWSLTRLWPSPDWSLTRLWPSPDSDHWPSFDHHLTVITDQTLTITWQWSLTRFWPSPDSDHWPGFDHGLIINNGIILIVTCLILCICHTVNGQACPVTIPTCLVTLEQLARQDWLCVIMFIEFWQRICFSVRIPSSHELSLSEALTKISIFLPFAFYYLLAKGYYCHVCVCLSVHPSFHHSRLWTMVYISAILYMSN